MTAEEFYEQAVRTAANPADPWEDRAQVEYRPPVGADPDPNPAQDTQPYAGGWADISVNDVTAVPSFPQGQLPDGEGVNPNTDNGEYEGSLAEELAERRRAAFGRSDDWGLSVREGGPQVEASALADSFLTLEPPESPRPRVAQAVIACSECGSGSVSDGGARYHCQVCGHVDNLAEADPTAEETANGDYYDGTNPASDTWPIPSLSMGEPQRTSSLDWVAQLEADR